jgi:polysaccharide biosynthesis transport protein
LQDIRRHLIVGLRWLPPIVICAIIAGAIAYAYSSGQPKVYEAKAILWVDPGQGYGTAQLSVAEATAVRYAEEAGSPIVAGAVVEELGLEESPRSVADRVSTEVSNETLELAIIARDEDPESARRLALAVGDEMVERVEGRLITPQVRATDNSIQRIIELGRQQQRRLSNLQRKTPKTPEDRQEIISLTGLIASLRRDAETLRPNSSAYVGNLLEWRAQPTTPTEPVEPQPLYWALLAIVVGGMGGAALAFVLEYLLFERKVRDERELETATGLPVFGLVTEKRGDVRRGDPYRLIVLRHPRSAAAEAYESLVAKIGYADGSVRSLLVASTGEPATRSVIAANIALAYAEASRNVILVDADFRAPRLHEFFDVPNDCGLTNLLGDPNVPLGWVTVPTAHPRLGLLPAGPRAETAGSLSAPVVNELMRRLMYAADMVVFAGPSITALDSAVLASHVEGSVLVVPAGTTSDAAAEAAAALEGAEAKLAGAVLYRQVRGAHPRGSAVKLVKPPVGFRPRPEPYTSPNLIPAVIPSKVQSNPSAEHGAPTVSAPKAEQAATPGPGPRLEPQAEPQGSPGPTTSFGYGGPHPRPGTLPPPPMRPQGPPWGPAPAASPSASNGRVANGGATVPPPPYAPPFDPTGAASKR